MFRVGVDAHVLTGRFQGTRTTLSSLLRAVSLHVRNEQVLVFSEDTQAAQRLVGGEGLVFKPLKAVGRVKRLLWTFPRLFAKHSVDIGVFQYISPPFGRNVVFIHDILPITHGKFFPRIMRLRTRLLFSLSIKRAALIIAVSEYTAGQLRRVYKLAPERVAVVKNGPSFPREEYFKETVESSPRYILAVGRIEARKNVPMLVDAFRQAAIPNVSLVIVGSHDLGFEYPIESCEAIKLRSKIDDDELIKLYRGASLFVYPSACEGFGIPLLDATLFGLPVICSDQTAMPEVGGDLVRYFNPTSANAVHTLSSLLHEHFTSIPIKHPTLGQRLAQADRFSWDASAEAFLHAINGLSVLVRPNRPSKAFRSI